MCIRHGKKREREIDYIPTLNTPRVLAKSAHTVADREEGSPLISPFHRKTGQMLTHSLPVVVPSGEVAREVGEGGI